MRERRGRVAKAYPSPSHEQRQSRSTHLLSIRQEQHGLPLHAAAYVHLELKKCRGFLEWRLRHVTSDAEKLFVVGCGIASSIQLRRAFARWTECALGNRGKRGI